MISHQQNDGAELQPGLAHSEAGRECRLCRPEAVAATHSSLFCFVLSTGQSWPALAGSSGPPGPGGEIGCSDGLWVSVQGPLLVGQALRCSVTALEGWRVVAGLGWPFSQ